MVHTRTKEILKSHK